MCGLASMEHGGEIIRYWPRGGGAGPVLYTAALSAAVACVLFILAGCTDSVSCLTPAAVSDVQESSLTSMSGLRDYLRAEPAVRSVTEWDNPYGEGLVVETSHYRLFTTLLDPLMLRQVPSFLEAAFDAYQTQLPQSLSTSDLFEVYLFGTRDQWEAYTRDTAGEDAVIYLKIQAGAYVSDGVCVAYNIGRRQTFSILGHEGWHQFSQRLFVYRLPSWLDEGIATLFETCRYDRGQFVFNPGSNLMRLGSLKQTLLDGRLVPLDQLLLLNPGQVLSDYSDDGGAVAGFYAQVYALVRFLREEGYGTRLRGYHAMLLGAANGNWPVEERLTQMAADRQTALTVGWNMQVSWALFAHYFGRDMKVVNAEYRAYCHKITYPVKLGK